MVPVCHAGGHPVRMREVNTLAAHPGFLLVIRRSGRQWTSHSRSGRHLCPVVCLGYPLLRLHPSLFPLIMPPLPCSLPYDIITQRYRQASKKPPGRTVYLSVCAFERSVNMEHKECCNPPLLPASTVLLSLQMDGLLGRYKTIGCTHTHMHTPTPPNSQTGVSRGPLLCRQRLMMCLTDSFIPKLVPFSPPFFFSSSLSISPSCCRKTQTCPLVNFEAE